MGKRLHYAKKYQIQFGTTSIFNYETCEFHDLLTSLGITFSGEPYDDDFDVQRNEWEQGLWKLKNLSTLDKATREEITKSLTPLDEPLDVIVWFMEKALIESDPTNDYIYLSFF